MPWRELAALWWLALCLAACRSPLSADRWDRGLQKTLAQSIARELNTLPEPQSSELSRRQPTTQPHSDVLESLASRRAELEKIGPLGQDRQPRFDLGPDLTGGDQQLIDLTLNGAIASAIDRNLGLQASRLQPGISAEDLIAAQAVFDWVVFGNVDLEKTDQPQRVPVLGGLPLGTPFNASQTYRFETGLRKRLMTGTDIFVSSDLTRFRNRAPGITFFPDPAYTAAVRVGLTQPLLRGFGSEVSTATIRISRNQERRSIQQVRSDLLQLAADTENAYWNLVFAWRDLAIAQWLVEAGVQVRQTVAGRREVDVTAAIHADAVARVEQRRADVIRAQRQVRAASDTLKALINDPQMTVSSESLLFPLDDTIETPITYNLREAIVTAIDNRPEIQQAALSIDDATIRQRVARNDRLPLLDLSAQMAYFGLNDEAGGAYSQAGEADFIDHILSLAFEMPLGNRAADAGFRAARLRRSAAVLEYQRTVQNVILDVKAALRDVITNYQLILATRSFRVAQAENLRALQIQEEALAGLTPEFLNLKFTRQETLGTARRQEVQALVDFDQALAQLYRAMGIGLKMKNIDVEVLDEDQ